MARKGLSKYGAYEGDPTVARWRANLARGSPITAEVALRRLGRACELLETTPQRLLEMADKDLKGLQVHWRIWWRDSKRRGRPQATFWAF